MQESEPNRLGWGYETNSYRVGKGSASHAQQLTHRDATGLAWVPTGAILQSPVSNTKEERLTKAECIGHPKGRIIQRATAKLQEPHPKHGQSDRDGTRETDLFALEASIQDGDNKDCRGIEKSALQKTSA
jgi:hypothetical protein